ncbi:MULTISPECIES: RidA family protein [unclassified Halanaerobium]|uniref:RidA family protein n=1 Tax=unclassified Halanaerobium TaxID=2641197 RepID=UPI000DF1B12A|nr:MULTISPECIES: Rid family detoxifying hydrolase [unclassified Halanaerobium]RCW42027.1 2-iminobutanoate/2-iminopropanoate deaminase [Halanaerobium sp. MA284_MarDTE_T2]RCW80734.1 2-iminobutanoate/2-iminopropanoate deaminase [Halanaerobium sp. DL-01]
MDKEIIYTENAPEPGNYSQAVKFGDLIFVSGQTADDPETGKPVHGTVAEQTELILTNTKNILEAAGSSMEKVLKVNVYISDMKYKKEMDEVYKTFFGNNPPARIAMAVKGLDAGLDVEIDVIAKA